MLQEDCTDHDPMQIAELLDGHHGRVSDACVREGQDHARDPEVRRHELSTGDE